MRINECFGLFSLFQISWRSRSLNPSWRVEATWHLFVKLLVSLSSIQKFRAILRCNSLRLLRKLGHLYRVELGWRCSARRYGHTELDEEPFVARWSADTDHPGWVRR